MVSVRKTILNSPTPLPPSPTGGGVATNLPSGLATQLFSKLFSELLDIVLSGRTEPLTNGGYATCAPQARSNRWYLGLALSLVSSCRLYIDPTSTQPRPNIDLTSTQTYIDSIGTGLDSEMECFGRHPLQSCFEGSPRPSIPHQQNFRSAWSLN